jgi:hypothetical protein
MHFPLGMNKAHEMSVKMFVHSIEVIKENIVPNIKEMKEIFKNKDIANQTLAYMDILT